MSSVCHPDRAVGAGSFPGHSIMMTDAEKLPLPAALLGCLAARLPMAPSIPACQGLLSLTVVKTKANSGSSYERKKRKGKEAFEYCDKVSHTIIE